ARAPRQSRVDPHQLHVSAAAPELPRPGRRRVSRQGERVRTGLGDRRQLEPRRMSRLRVLHLEHSEPDGELLARRLTSEGGAAQIVRVATLPAFQSALAAGGFDLIISDYSLPGADGLQALALAIELAPHIPFLMVTGTIGEEKAAAALKAGATDFILKDRLERLAPAARRALAEVAERRQRQLAEDALRQ